MCKKNCDTCNDCKNESEFTNREFHFTDEITFDVDEKKLVSVTDGMLSYSGMELGREPANKIFKVFRDAQTIIDLVPKLIDLPITDAHVDPTIGTTPDNVIGKLTGSQLKYFDDPEKLATVFVENTAYFDDDVIIKKGEHLSLGYVAKLAKAEDGEPFDFRQTDINPHHLAKLGDVKGRCGSTCTFIDKELDMSKKEVKKLSEYKLRDEDGSINLTELMELIAALPEAVGSLDVDRIKELVPIFKEIIEVARAKREEQKIETEEKPEDESVAEEVKTEDKEDKEVTELKAMDASSFKDAISGMVSVGVAAAMKEYTFVVDKARNFLDAAYPFGKKTTKQIMSDAVATRHQEKFNDHELGIAFKLLAKHTGYEKFGDSKTECAFEQLKDKEL